MTSHRGFIWFSIGLAIAFFFGGAIRTFSSKKNLDTWLQRHIQKERVQFIAEWKDIRLSLADGWFPALGFEVKDVHIKPQDPCLVAGELFIDQARVSLDWWNWIFHNNIRIGKLKAHRIDITWGESECVLSRWSAQSLQSWRDLFQKRWATEIIKNRQWLESAQIEELHLQVIGKRSFDVSFVDLAFRTGDVVRLKSNVRLPQVENAWVQVEADEAGFLLKSKIALKEGSFVTESKLSVQDQTLQTEVGFQNVPFYSFLSLWNWWASSSLDFKSRRLWVEGLAHMTISFAETKILPVRVGKLNVKGEAGHIQLQPFEWDFSRNQLTETLKFNVNKLSLNAFIENLEQFMPKLGLLTGQGTLDVDGKIEFKGLIENIEVYFFNLRARARQSINSVHVNLLGQLNQFIEAQFDDFDIVGGELKGGEKSAVTWKWLVKENTVEWKTAIQRLILSQDVQRLLWGQVADPFQADVTLINKEDSWSMYGSVKVPQIGTDQFLAKNLELYKNQKEGLNPWRMKLQQLDILPDQTLRARLTPWLPSLQYPQVTLSQISGVLEFGRDRWSWEDVRGQVTSPKLNWKTKGNWIKNAGLHGTLDTDGGAKKRFEILGGTETWEIKPQDEMN